MLFENEEIVKLVYQALFQKVEDAKKVNELVEEATSDKT